jgi:hypothetical protein
MVGNLSLGECGYYLSGNNGHHLLQNVTTIVETFTHPKLEMFVRNANIPFATCKFLVRNYVDE